MACEPCKLADRSRGFGIALVRLGHAIKTQLPFQESTRQKRRQTHRHDWNVSRRHSHVCTRWCEGPHIGYNGVGGLSNCPTLQAPLNRALLSAGKTLDVPQKLFKWVDLKTNTSLLTMIEASYGNEVDVPLAGNGSEATLYRSSAAPDTGLLFHYFVDNSGVAAAEEVTAFWLALQAKHPDATIILGTMDDFVDHIEKAGDLTKIPVVEQEIGDSWLYGVSADPIKVAEFRQARRSYAKRLRQALWNLRGHSTIRI